MAYDSNTPYDPTNKGYIAKNERKESETHADYTGKVNIDGKEYWLNAWIKVGRDGTKLSGQKYFSLGVRPVLDQAAPRRPAPAPAPRAAAPSRNSGFEEMADDVPF